MYSKKINADKYVETGYFEIEVTSDKLSLSEVTSCLLTIPYDYTLKVIVMSRKSIDIGC